MRADGVRKILAPADLGSILTNPPALSTLGAFSSRAAVGEGGSPGLMFPAMDQRRSIAVKRPRVLGAVPHPCVFATGIPGPILGPFLNPPVLPVVLIVLSRWKEEL